MAREMIAVPLLDIQHFGSTSIKGMSAKPIIDIMIVVEDINQIDSYNEIMIEEGYNPRGENGIEGRRYFVRLGPDAAGVFNNSRELPIYCVDSAEKKVAITFDCAWGAVI